MEIPKFRRGDYYKEYKELTDEDMGILDKYGKMCEEGCNKEKALDMKRNVLKFKLTLNKPFSEINLEDTKDFMQVLKKSKIISDSAKNDMKVHIVKMLKFMYKDWSERFDDFKSPLFKLIKDPKRKRKITSEEVLSKDQIKKMLITENKTFWKAFLMTQYEGALRTKENRELTWVILGEPDEDFYSFNLHSTKNNKDKPIVLHEAKVWIDRLKQEQINTNSKGKYIFHSKRDVNKPIDKATVSIWMRGLSKKALGREIWCYILRHTRGTEYKTLIKEKKLSKDNALETMGHSEKMFDKIYSHVDKETIRNMIKEQVYNFEDLPPKEKKKLELQIKKLQEEQEKMKKDWNEQIRTFANQLQKNFKTTYRGYEGTEKNQEKIIKILNQNQSKNGIDNSS